MNRQEAISQQVVRAFAVIEYGRRAFRAGREFSPMSDPVYVWFIGYGQQIGYLPTDCEILEDAWRSGWRAESQAAAAERSRA